MLEWKFLFAQPFYPNPELRPMLEAVKPTAAGVRYEHRLMLGAPADEIVRLAAAEGVDLIVMATHGRTGIGRLVMGSVAEAVMRDASCPVLILKPGSRVSQPAGSSEASHHKD